MTSRKPEMSKCFPREETFTNLLRCWLIRHILSEEFLNTKITHRTGFFMMDNHRLSDPVGSHTIEIKDDIAWLKDAEGFDFAALEVKTFTSTTSDAPRKLIRVKASALDYWGRVITYVSPEDDIDDEFLSVCWSSINQGVEKNLTWMKKGVMPLSLGYICHLVREVTKEFFDGHGEWVEPPRKEIEDRVTGFVNALDWEEDVEKTTFWRL